MNWRLSKKRNKQRGVAAVETALLTLFLISIAIGVAEFGRAIFYFESLAKGARAAARYAVVFKSSRTNFAAEARNLALCGLTSCPVNGTRIAPGLTLSNISVNFGGPGGTAALTNVAAETPVLALRLLFITGRWIWSRLPLVQPRVLITSH